MADEKKSDFNDITGLWLKESAGGTKYMNSQLTKDKHLEKLEKLVADLKAEGTLYLSLWKVKNKTTDKSPDYSLCYTKPRKTEAGPARQAQSAQPAQADEDIPF